MVDRAAIPQVSEEELVAPFDDAQGDRGQRTQKDRIRREAPLCGFGKLFQIPFSEAGES